MKAVAANRTLNGQGNNFYISTLAPVNQRRHGRFRGADAVVLVVLFVEIAAVMRLFLAK